MIRGWIWRGIWEDRKATLVRKPLYGAGYSSACGSDLRNTEAASGDSRLYEALISS